MQAKSSRPLSIDGGTFAEDGDCVDLEIPNIEGLWRRPFDNLYMPIEQNGLKISSEFEHGNYKHILTGHYETVSGKFEHITIREHNIRKLKTVMRGTIELHDGALRVVTIGTDGRAELPVQFNEVADLKKVVDHVTPSLT